MQGLAHPRSGLMLSVLAALLVLAACSKKEETPATAAAPDPNALEGQVDIVAWAGYIERGETDKAYDWVSQF
jgi:putative spermidine/putrescine transport system substrate-binding protein